MCPAAESRERAFLGGGAASLATCTGGGTPPQHAPGMPLRCAERCPAQTDTPWLAARCTPGASTCLHAQPPCSRWGEARGAAFRVCVLLSCRHSCSCVGTDACGNRTHTQHACPTRTIQRACFQTLLAAVCGHCHGVRAGGHPLLELRMLLLLGLLLRLCCCARHDLLVLALGGFARCCCNRARLLAAVDWGGCICWLCLCHDWWRSSSCCTTTPFHQDCAGGGPAQKQRRRSCKMVGGVARCAAAELCGGGGAGPGADVNGDG